MTAAVQPRGVAIAGLAWLVVAALAGATGVLLQLPFPGAQLIILGVTVAAVAVSLTALRPWLETVPLRWLIGINALRFVGIVFLVLAARGTLSPTFAMRAGWGDIAVAAGAVVLTLWSANRFVLHVWNAFGFLDLIVAVATATFVTGTAPLLTFPLSLVPTVAVPLFLANHIVIFRRLAR